MKEGKKKRNPFKRIDDNGARQFQNEFKLELYQAIVGRGKKKKICRNLGRKAFSFSDVISPVL